MFPSVVNPKPVCGVAADGSLKRGVHVTHNSFRATRLGVFMRRDLRTGFNAPLRNSHAVTYRGVERTFIAEREKHHRRAGGGIMAKEGQLQTLAARSLNISRAYLHRLVRTVSEETDVA